MFTDDDTRASFKRCEFKENHAMFGGGGVFSQDDDSEIHLTNSWIHHNRGFQGGAFYMVTFSSISHQSSCYSLIFVVLDIDFGARD